MSTPVLPPGSYDTHFHIFPPNHQPAPQSSFRPPQFPNSVADAYHDDLGVTHRVLVSSFSFGVDSSSLDEWLALPLEGGERKGVMAIDEDSVTAERLRDMDKRGVRGARMDFGATRPDVVKMCETVKKTMEVLEKAGVEWHVVVQDKNPLFWEHLASILPSLPKSIPMIIDHLGLVPGPWSRPSALTSPPAIDPTLPGLAAITTLLRSPAPVVYIKLSAPYRITAKDELTENLVLHYATTAPDTILWGSDWPHTPISEDSGMEYRKEDVKGWLGMLKAWLGKELWTKMLVDNPAKLYSR